MKKLCLGNEIMEASQIGLGCMRIASLGTKQAVRTLINTAMDQGINFFDHADIYAGGEAERIFGEAIVGSTNPRRIMDIARASDVTLTREEWYALYMAAGKQLP